MALGQRSLVLIQWYYISIKILTTKFQNFNSRKFVSSSLLLKKIKANLGNFKNYCRLNLVIRRSHATQNGRTFQKIFRQILM